MDSDQTVPSTTGDVLREQLRPALVGIIIFTLLTGLLYPAAVTGLAQLVFPDEANGSIIEGADRQPVGSALIGQHFEDPAYFWPRPSATGPVPYNGASSSGWNLGPLSPELLARVEDTITTYREADPGNNAPIPVDLVTASGSGLDPHISVAGAEYQTPRVARERSLSEAQVLELIERYTEDRTFGILGEPGVNVLSLNLELDRLAPLE